MDKTELGEILEYEKKLYLGDKSRQLRRVRHKRYTLWLYLRYFRLCQYWRGIRSGGETGRFGRLRAKYLSRMYERKKNKAGEKAGVEIGLQSSVGKGLDMWHSGIVINGTLGEGCVLRGNNTIGGKADIKSVPVIGERVNIGAGAVIIGDVKIADDCVIGANAVVTKSFAEPGSVIVGIPAAALPRKEKQ